MIKKLFSILLCAGSLMTLSNNTFAQTKLIHYWHFNNDTAYVAYTDTIHGIAADYSTIDTSKAKVLYAKWAGVTAAYSTYLDKYTPLASDNDTFNARMGALPGRALRTRNPSDSMDLLYYIPTTHYKNIKLKFSVERSNNGPQQEIYDYSVDSGMTWKTSGLSVLTDSPSTGVFSLVSETFSDTLANNNRKLVFRIKFAGMNSGTSGNNRFDNITVEGDTVTSGTGPGSVAQVQANNKYVIYPNPVSNVLNVVSLYEGTKTVAIYDITGREILATTASGKEFSIPVSLLESGIYIIKLSDTEAVGTSMIQFIKQ